MVLVFKAGASSQPRRLALFALKSQRVVFCLVRDHENVKLANFFAALSEALHNLRAQEGDRWMIGWTNGGEQRKMEISQEISKVAAEHVPRVSRSVQLARTQCRQNFTSQMVMSNLSYDLYQSHLQLCDALRACE